MREGNSFSLSTLVEGGGYPIPDLDGEVPHSAEGGTPSKIRMGSTPSQVWMAGYPIPDLDGEVPHSAEGGIPSKIRTGSTPSQVWMGGGGYPHPRSGRGYLILLIGGRGYPHPRSGRGEGFTQEDFLVW